MRKYIFQTGGEEDLYSSTDFFNSYIDQLLNTEETSNDVQPEVESEEETDFIKNLREYADEQDKPDYESILNQKVEELKILMDEKLSFVRSKIDEYSWYEDDDNIEYLSNMYDTRNSNVPFSASKPTTGGGKARNNYGNIRDVKTGQFRSFNTPQEGRQALEHQLYLYQSGKTRNPVKPNSSLYHAMSVYAPAADRNNPKKYAEFIAKKLGISPNTPISQIDRGKWADAIAIMEGNKNIDRN